MPNQAALLLDLNDQKRFLDTFLDIATEPPFTPKQMFFRSLLRRDWTYTMSDDRKVHVSGDKHLRELRQQYENLKLTGQLHEPEMVVINYCLQEMVLDIPENYKALMDGQAGRDVELDINPCVQFIAKDLPPRTTFDIVELHRRLLEVRGLLQNLGKLDYGRRVFVYSPHMILQKFLIDSVYSTSFGRTQYAHVAISEEAEHAIKRLFDQFTPESFNLYVNIMGSKTDSVDLLNILTAENHNGDTRHTHLRLGDALIALPHWYEPFAPNREYQTKLYRRDIDRHTLALFRKYRAELETLIINRQYGVE